MARAEGHALTNYLENGSRGAAVERRIETGGSKTTALELRDEYGIGRAGGAPDFLICPVVLDASFRRALRATLLEPPF
jgi:hypothetical protein